MYKNICVWYMPLIQHVTLCDKNCQGLAAGQWFPPGTLVSSTNKTDRHDITEVALNKRERKKEKRKVYKARHFYIKLCVISWLLLFRFVFSKYLQLLKRRSVIIQIQYFVHNIYNPDTIFCT